MKRLLALVGLTLTVCALACAQESAGGRVVVPARNTGHPRVVHTSMLNGSITVKTYNGKDVIVETGPAGRVSESAPVGGMRRLDLSGHRGLTVEEEDNVITVRTSPENGHGNITITVPPDTSLDLKCHAGSINVDGVHGEIEANSHNGQITLTNVSGTVVAHSFNGALKVTMDRVDPGKPISFSTFNGPVDVTLPADLKANVKIKSNRGEVFSDFEMKLTGGPTAAGSSSGGRFRVVMDRTIFGEINGGGTEVGFTTFNGAIYLRKKK